MKQMIVLVISILAFACIAGSKSNKKLTVTEKFRKKVDGVDQIVVRDGGGICCVSALETLKQPVFFTVRDPEEIQKIIDNLEFLDKVSNNNCFCCGYPGIDFYRGKKRILITGYEHGDGLKIKGKIISFTDKTKIWIAKWLLENNFLDKYKECKKIIEASDKK